MLINVIRGIEIRAYMYIVLDYFTSENFSHKANVTRLKFRGLPLAAFSKTPLINWHKPCILAFTSASWF